MPLYVTRKKIQPRAKIYLGFVSVAAILACLGTGYLITKRFEGESLRRVSQNIPAQDTGWLSVHANGLFIELSGTAPDQFASPRVVENMGKVIHVNRIRNHIKLPEVRLSGFETHVEIVQNDQISSIVGLMPNDPSPAELYRAMERAQPLVSTLNLVEDSHSKAPGNWAEMLKFMAYAVGETPRLKLSATPEEIKIDAVSPSESEANTLRKNLTENAPAGIKLTLNVSAPRKLIVPFEFKLSKTTDKLELNTCSATNREDLQRIQAIAADLNMENCALGLGAPTDSWGLTVANILAEAQKAPSYNLSIRDNQVDLQISDQVPADQYDLIVSNIRANLPPGFGFEPTRLVTIKTIEELRNEGETTNLAITKDADGKVKINGVLGSAESVESFLGFAAAKFGSEQSDIKVDIVEGLPMGWEKNAFTILQVVATMPHGQAILSEGQIVVEGAAESQEVLDGLEKILNSETSEVAISTNLKVEADLSSGVSDEGVTASQCLESLNALLAKNPIQFEKGSANISDISNTVISQLGQILYNCRSYSFEITGHTDDSGPAADNDRVSQSRAEAVLNALSELALDFGPITAKGYGANEPVASNDTEDGRAKNRRIEIRLSEETGE